MQTPLTTISGKERYSIRPDKTVYYGFHSDCGAERYETIAYNLEAARAKRDRHFAAKRLKATARQPVPQAMPYTLKHYRQL